MNTHQKSPTALIWLVLSIAMILLDQWTKSIATANLQLGESVTFIDGFWDWTMAHNRGAAFSFLANSGDWAHWFFVVMKITVSLVLTYLLARMPRNRWRDAFPFALIIAGALGNLIDRFRFGYVVDFIEWYVGTYHWPVFNIADSCIVVGAVLLILFSFGKRDEVK
ncbi:MAG: signal peptidase II [Arenimonas sp.]